MPSVAQGNVTLEGSVGSWYTRRRAESKVRWLPGVRNVGNELTVVVSENEGTRTADPVVPDDSLAANVRMQIRRDSRIDASRVEADARSGNVTLLGSIPSSYQRNVVLEDAKDTIGVAWVTDKLVVAAVPRSDEAIRTDVAWDLEVDYSLSGTDLRVAVKDGPTLARKLHTYDQKYHASDVAHRIHGVRRVVNDIEVVGDKIADKTIADSVASRLKWNTRTYSPRPRNRGIG